MRKSAGILPFRRKGTSLEVLLVHMSGPFWQHQDEGAWSIVKGEFDDTEMALEAAKREFKEETGFVPTGTFIELTPIKQAGGKRVFAWALEFDCEASKAKSNTFKMEWPKGSGTMCEFPEVDRAEWFSLEQAHTKILKSQVPLIAELEKIVHGV